MKIFIFIMLGLVILTIVFKEYEVLYLLVFIFLVVLAVKGIISVFKKNNDGLISFGKERRKRNKKQ